MWGDTKFRGKQISFSWGSKKASLLSFSMSSAVTSLFFFLAIIGKGCSLSRMAWGWAAEPYQRPLGVCCRIFRAGTLLSLRLGRGRRPEAPPRRFSGGFPASSGEGEKWVKCGVSNGRDGSGVQDGISACTEWPCSIGWLVRRLLRPLEMLYPYN